MAVIAAFKFDDFVAFGITPRKADGAHGGFSAGVNHANHVHAGHDTAELFGELGFYFCWCAKAKAFLELGGNACNDIWVGVAE